MSDLDDRTVDVIYIGPKNDLLNEQIGQLATRTHGQFEGTLEKDSVTMLTYVFPTPSLARGFLEQANLIISRHFGIKAVNVEELLETLQFGTDRGIYHHVEFDEEIAAHDFATALKAVFCSYLPVDMFDIRIVNPLEEGGGHIVLYGFPLESIQISPDMMNEYFGEEEEEDQVEDFLVPLNKKKKDILN